MGMYSSGVSMAIVMLGMNGYKVNMGEEWRWKMRLGLVVRDGYLCPGGGEGGGKGEWGR